MKNLPIEAIWVKNFWSDLARELQRRSESGGV